MIVHHCASFPRVLLALMALAAAFSSSARAQILQAPVGGRAIPLGDLGIACGPADEGWTIESGGRMLLPPRREDAIGEQVPLKVAPNAAGCEESERWVELVATGRWPSFDAASIVFWPDDGRLEAKGRRLRGVSIAWQSEDRSGLDRCNDPTTTGPTDACIWSMGREASADPNITTFTWLPSGAQLAEDARTFDIDGRLAAPGAFALLPARFVITHLFEPGATVDLASGQGHVPLVHPEVVASGECAALECAMSEGKFVVRGASRLVNSIEVKLRLRPHVYLLKQDVYDIEATAKLPVSHCPMAIVSGPPIRDNDDAAVVVRLEKRCAGDLTAVRFMSDDSPLKVMRTGSDQEAVYVLLRLGDIESDTLSITAVRGPSDIALAVTQTPTRSAPQVRASLELPGFPNLDFIPNNRWAAVHVSPPGEGQGLALLPIEGVYDAGGGAESPVIRGEVNAAGMTALRFGVRSLTLPAGFDQADLAVVTDPLQRGIREANIPAPIGDTLLGNKPLIEVLCGGGKAGVRQVLSTETIQVPFALRDTCRVIFHRERLSSDYGTQHLNLEIEVFTSYGIPRSEARISEVMTFRHGDVPRVGWIKGVEEAFDRVVVRVSHQADDAHYIGASEIRTGAPSAQWSVILGTGSLRLYATSTIPAGLYRISDQAHSGVMSLNFGVLSRLTWLDHEGREGLIGLEGGVLVKSIGNALSQGGQAINQVGVGLVLGFGLSVPIANRSQAAQASIDLHLWGEMDVSSEDQAGRFAIVFGPSISVGNIGTNL
jgi:hypothetical protein